MQVEALRLELKLEMIEVEEQVAVAFTQRELTIQCCRACLVGSVCWVWQLQMWKETAEGSVAAEEVHRTLSIESECRVNGQLSDDKA